MSFHKKKRERQFNSQLRGRSDETPVEVQWRCPAFCAVFFAVLFNLVVGGALVAYYALQWNG